MNPLRRWTQHPLWDEEEGPARPLAAKEIDAIARAVLERYAPDPEPPSEAEIERFLPRKRRRWIALVAAAMLLTLGALAATSTPRPPNRSILPQDTVRTSRSGPPPTQGGAVAPSPTENRDDGGATLPVSSGTSRTEAPPSARHTSEPDAEGLWELANTLRSQRRWQESASAYERVVALAPHGSKAYTARVLAGSLRLEHLRDPRGALALYRSALAEQPRGALSEEARWGVVECFHALGDATSEREALRAFAATYPESPMHARAESRIAELEGAGGQ